MPDNSAERMCMGKVSYPTFQRAREIATKMSQERRTTIRPYRCPYGFHWHIGHPPRPARPFAK
jgi:hypothetical protein